MKHAPGFLVMIGLAIWAGTKAANGKELLICGLIVIGLLFGWRFLCYTDRRWKTGR